MSDAHASNRSGACRRLSALLLCGLAVVASFGLAARLSAAEGSWIGKQVMPRQSGVRVWYTDDPWRDVRIGPFEDMVVPVLAERGEWIEVRHRGQDAWFARQDAVLLDDAVAYFTEKIRANPGDPFAHVLRAEAWHEKRQWDAAVADYTEAIRLRPDNAGLFSNRGVLYLEKKDYERAIADFDAAVRLCPKSAVALRSRAFAHAARGDYDQAIRDYDEAIYLDPHDPALYHGRAAASAQKGDTSRALCDYHEAIRLDPTFPRSHVNRGLVLLGRREYESAIQDFETAIRLAPNDRAAYTHLAWVRATAVERKWRDGAAAMQWATRACRLSAWRDARALEALAAAYAECGGFADAVRWQQKALEFGYGDSASTSAARQRLPLYAEGKPCRD